MSNPFFDQPFLIQRRPSVLLSDRGRGNCHLVDGGRPTRRGGQTDSGAPEPLQCRCQSGTGSDRLKL